ncbi:MAG: hypothetical protein NVS2B16_14100 [Chloroflexota bacterium]
MNDHVSLLREQARALPESPGVYFWKDSRHRILYIGKAVNLRARVSSYFSTAAHDRRTRELLTRARTIDHEVTATELQALFRESARIKQDLPPFNRLLRTSRKLFYLKFDAAHEDPYMEISRQIVDDGSLYFGPFRTAAVMRETMQFLHAALPLRKCKAAKPRCKPCLYYQMHTCAAPALDDIHRAQHREAIHRLYELLDGRSDRVTRWLETKRDHLCDLLLFERAAEVQGRIEALEQLLERQTILEAAVQCRCVLIAQDGPHPVDRRLLLVARGNVVSVRDRDGAAPDAVMQWVRAHEVLIYNLMQQQGELDSAGVLERWLSTKRKQARWIAIPHECDDADLQERVLYALHGHVGDPAPVGGRSS